MGLIFLDMDGCLITKDCYDKPFIPTRYPERLGYPQLNPECVKNLQTLKEAFKPHSLQIVLNSVWKREYKKDDRYLLYQHLLQSGVEIPILGQTPVILSHIEHTKGDEITAWFELNPFYLDVPFIILDDDSDVEPYQDHLVLTSWEKGLEAHHVQEAIKILRGGC